MLDSHINMLKKTKLPVRVDLIFFVITILAIFSILSSCSFRPLYNKNADDISLSDELATIRIDIKNSNVDNKDLKFALERVLNPYKTNEKTKYLLKISLNKNISPAVIQTDNQVPRYNLSSKVFFELIKLPNYTTIEKGSLNMTSSFGTTKSAYGSYVVEESTSDNNIREICEELKHRLSVILMNSNNENK